MTYLLQYATRRVPRKGARVDERTPLNRPGLYGGAYVRVFVEDTTSRRWRRRPPEPRIRLRIADCVNEINLEFSLESAELRENSLYKVDTLLSALTRFRGALDAEVGLYVQREQRRGWRNRETKGGKRCRT
jgi:hypothetical protein